MTQHLDREDDGIDRRGFLKCMAWAGTGLIWTVSGGIPASRALGQSQPDGSPEFTFVQISDSHIGFNKPANTDVNATMQAAIDKINSLPRQPDFVIHTGDLTHLAKPAEFATLADLLSGARQRELRCVPGEHDTASDDGKEYLARYGKGTRGNGWFSFDHRGVHFVGLVNVFQLEGLGRLGAEQLQWLKQDLNAQLASAPVVVFAHIPLWMVYPEWGWGTEDGEQALGYLRRFGSVTVLNGHIHQTMQKVEGNVTFHTAMSTACPQPAPGKAAAPGPMIVPADRLKTTLGISDVAFVAGARPLAIVDSALSIDGGRP